MVLETPERKIVRGFIIFDIVHDITLSEVNE
jgi:hypothetical protein